MSRCLPGAFRKTPATSTRMVASEDDAVTMLYPMYTVRAEVLLEMTVINAHEKLKARGEAIIFEESMGNAAFISHQWVSKNHPDPEFEQTRVLQDVLRHLLHSQGSVSLDLITEAMVPGARGVSHQAFQARPLFIWYDYFSVPQDVGSGRQEANAIQSIPIYIAMCSFFFALCPTISCPAEARVLNAASWATRGWCRLERAARELSAQDSWILVRGGASFQVVGTAFSFFSGSVGEGQFSFEEDRQKLAPVMTSIVRKKLLLSLQAGDMPAYRRHLNLQGVYLRGLDAEPVRSLIPGNDANPTENDQPVTTFLSHNGLVKVSSQDSAGFWPLHYAALLGNAQVLDGLLAQRANVNQRTAKPEPKLGLPRWMTPLDLAICFRHNHAAQQLISVHAHLEGGLLPSMQIAAQSNASGIRLLCAAAGDPLVHNFFGSSPLQAAAAYGNLAAVEELLAQAPHPPHELGKALQAAMATAGGFAELAERLISLRADVDFRYDLRRDSSCLGRMLVAAQCVKHRFGRQSPLSSSAYHQHGSTPLMMAAQTAQHEGAAVLIAAGARLDLRNCRNWKAADFAKGQELPSFLRQGFEGDPTACRRVASLALPDGYVEIPI